ncbi:hypothetical protein DPX16_12515 [Anabarilius grahami]|uniref:Uncharacterized protein n=1 Tax=Anabarilius grahami TaxID=495550 RepID=A0A3N0XR87_ANAGA|nr:hypothetical protein DPX16_12515 [Anabarilius grahami]
MEEQLWEVLGIICEDRFLRGGRGRCDGLIPRKIESSRLQRSAVAAGPGSHDHSEDQPKTVTDTEKLLTRSDIFVIVVVVIIAKKKRHYA